MSKKIEGGNLLKLLKRVHLGGLLEETVVDFNTGVIQAVDTTNSIFLRVSEDVQTKGFGQVGLGSIGMLTKYLDMMKGEVTIDKDGNRLVLHSGERGFLRYLTLDPEFVSTVAKSDNVEGLTEPAIIKVPLTDAFCKDFLAYSGLVKSKAVDFTVEDSGLVVASAGLESEHQFTLPVGTGMKLTKKKTPTFATKVYSAHLEAVMSILEWTEKETPEMLLAPDHPVIIKQNEGNFWALLPLGDVETQ